MHNSLYIVIFFACGVLPRTTFRASRSLIFLWRWCCCGWRRRRCHCYFISTFDIHIYTQKIKIHLRRRIRVALTFQYEKIKFCFFRIRKSAFRICLRVCVACGCCCLRCIAVGCVCRSIGFRIAYFILVFLSLSLSPLSSAALTHSVSPAQSVSLIQPRSMCRWGVCECVCVWATKIESCMQCITSSSSPSWTTTTAATACILYISKYLERNCIQLQTTTILRCKYTTTRTRIEQSLHTFNWLTCLSVCVCAFSASHHTRMHFRRKCSGVVAINRIRIHSHLHALFFDSYVCNCLIFTRIVCIRARACSLPGSPKRVYENVHDAVEENK